MSLFAIALILCCQETENQPPFSTLDNGSLVSTYFRAGSRFTEPQQPLVSLQSAQSPDLIRAFITDSQSLSNPIDTTTVTDQDNERVEQEVADYRALAERVADGRYEALPNMQRQAMMQGLQMFYDGAAIATDQEIEHARSLVTGRGGADAAHNFLIAHDAYLYAAEQLFPGNPAYAAARQKLTSVLAEYGGSRAGINAAEEAAEIAAAKRVRMPAAVTTDKGAEALFRQAWRTSGIDWQIMKINVTSGWRDKVEYGRVIGQRRDAAIAARDPSNPNRCNLYDFTMFRDKSGAVRRDAHNTTRIACENVR